MRLLNIESLNLVEYSNEMRPPPYAILSHRWGDDEMTYESFIDPSRRSGAGFTKIQDFCSFLLKTRSSSVEKYPAVKLCWIDTCCIDKRSSAELSEAINAMAKWYQESQFCVVHLKDVSQRDWVTVAPLEERTEITNSDWFTRGWTLQELLFSTNVIFCDRDWDVIHGLDKYSELGCAILSRITHIPQINLRLRSSIFSCSVADRMNWAARRETSRLEDEAYCLLGIFRINMPLLYGEGRNAFIRLQEEIIKKYEDESIFAWLVRFPSKFEEGRLSPILAAHPSTFEYRFRSSISAMLLEGRKPFQMTNRGLELETSAIEVSNHGREDWPQSVFIVQMNCCVKFRGSPAALPCLLALARCPGNDKLYVRAFSWKLSRGLWQLIVEGRDVQVRKHPRMTFYIATSWSQMGQASNPASTAAAVLPDQTSALNQLFEKYCEDRRRKTVEEDDVGNCPD